VVKRLRRATALVLLPDTRVTLLALSEIVRRNAGAAPATGGDCDLTRFELQVFSQNGEDGVIAEILQRIGTGARYFVEFGVGGGVEANCAMLADVFGWHGLFIEGEPRLAGQLTRKYAANASVTTRHAMVSPENIEALFAEASVPPEPDVLSIDIDGADYYIWQAIERYRARLVVIEYNSSIDLTRPLVQPSDAEAWDETDYYGASLAALEALGARKGYRLVHTELTGNNAFFVRKDLCASFAALPDVRRRASNFSLRGLSHLRDPHGRRYVDLGADVPRDELRLEGLDVEGGGFVHSVSDLDRRQIGAGASAEGALLDRAEANLAEHRSH